MAEWVWPNGSTGTKTVSVSVTAERPQYMQVEAVPEKEAIRRQKALEKVYDYLFKIMPMEHVLGVDNLDYGFAPKYILVNIPPTTQEYMIPSKGELVILYNGPHCVFGEVTKIGDKLEVKPDWDSYC